MDIFSDNMFEEHELKNIDIKDFCVNSPIVGDAVRTLYDKYIQNKKDLGELADQMISVRQEISDTVGSENSMLILYQTCFNQTITTFQILKTFQKRVIIN